MFGPGETLTRVQVGEALYTVPNKARLGTVKSPDQLSTDRSEPDVALVRFKVGEDLYTVPTTMSTV